MNKLILATTAILIAAAPAAALADAGGAAVTKPAVTQPVPATMHRSRVHDVHGQRFDVPNSLMRDRTTLINGLPPQPQQFD